MNRNSMVWLNTIVCMLCLFLGGVTIHAQTTVYTGKVISATTKEPLSAASIAVVGTTKGTYTRNNGNFRLPLTTGTYKLRVRSIGYAEKTVEITPATTDITITLIEKDQVSKTVSVVADISAEQIIKKAIEKKHENAKRINTLISTLYSKMRVDIDQAGTTSTDLAERSSITETYSTIYAQREPKPRKHTVIHRRRQTANILPGQNNIVFDKFFDFTDDELDFGTLKLVTPLADNALGEYKYTMLNKTDLGDLRIYQIAFEPRSRLFPGFEGVLQIAEHTNQVVGASFSPSVETAIPFIDKIKYQLRYELVDSVWVPKYQQADVDIKANIVTGLVQVKGKLNIETFVTEVKANVPIPDSVFMPRTDSTNNRATNISSGAAKVTVNTSGNSIVVEPTADSTSSDFWKEHSFAEQTEEERTVFARMDSVVAARPKADSTNTNETSESAPGLFSMNIGGIGGIGITPALDRTSLSGMMYGASLNILSHGVLLESIGLLGGNNTKAGSVGLKIPLFNESDFSLELRGKVFSQFKTIANSIEPILNLDELNLLRLLYPHHFDFYRADGWQTSVYTKVYRKFSALLEYREEFVIPMSIHESPNRVVVLPQAGRYQIGSAQLKYSFGKILSLSAQGTIGTDITTATTFESLLLTAHSEIPTFETGYEPFTLTLEIQAGKQSITTPVQYQFTLFRRTHFFSDIHLFATPNNSTFGGTEFVSAYAQYNVTDLWWRALGLPTFNKRGLDLIAVGGVASFTQRSTPVVPNSIFDSTPGIYGEAGFALDKIPVFSDFIAGRIDCMWPVGPAANRGSFGWSISVSIPLLKF